MKKGFEQCTSHHAISELCQCLTLKVSSISYVQGGGEDCLKVSQKHTKGVHKAKVYLLIKRRAIDFCIWSDLD